MLRTVRCDVGDYDELYTISHENNTIMCVLFSSFRKSAGIPSFTEDGTIWFSAEMMKFYQIKRSSAILILQANFIEHISITIRISHLSRK